jgi:hypothetical protein
MRIFIFFFISIISISQLQCQNLKDNTYTFRYRDNIRNSEQKFFLSKDIINDTITLTYFDLKNSDTTILYQENLTTRNNSIFLDRETELRLNDIVGSCYKTGNSKVFNDSVKVCLTKSKVDTIINNVSYTYNVYEIYYSDFKMEDIENLRLYLDLNKKIFIKKEYFRNEYIVGEEALVQ